MRRTSVIIYKTPKLFVPGSHACPYSTQITLNNILSSSIQTILLVPEFHRVSRGADKSAVSAPGRGLYRQ